MQAQPHRPHLQIKLARERMITKQTGPQVCRLLIKFYCWLMLPADAKNQRTNFLARIVLFHFTSTIDYRPSLESTQITLQSLVSWPCLQKSAPEKL